MTTQVAEYTFSYGATSTHDGKSHTAIKIYVNDILMLHSNLTEYPYHRYLVEPHKTCFELIKNKTFSDFILIDNICTAKGNANYILIDSEMEFIIRLNEDGYQSLKEALGFGDWFCKMQRVNKHFH